MTQWTPDRRHGYSKVLVLHANHILSYDHVKSVSSTSNCPSSLH
jgi:hypothetical protein